MASLKRSRDQIRLMRAGLLVLGLAAVGNALNVWNVHDVIGRLPSVCLFHALTGYDCPGCGMGRALLLLTQGRIIASLHQHPFGVPLVAWAAGWTLLPEGVFASLHRHRLLRSNALAAVAAGLVILWWLVTKVA
ncbi:MAG: DUF2752 domain-containing protein [Deltaproteobacteria bacterium]|nr:DUF2752 domain-containing protein [Deltaproteobacteria bacterium]MBI3390271.1 DUF2752 domain-containing protein [Deltaproteobacteria bacterium]